MNSKKIFKPARIELLSTKIEPCVFIGILSLTALINFLLKYGFFPGGSFKDSTFYIDFFVFYFLLIVSVFILTILRGFYFQLIALFMGTMASSLMAYTSGDFWTIKIFIFSAWVFSVILSIKWKWNIALAFLCIAAFMACQQHPAFLGLLDEADLARLETPVEESVALAVWLFFIALFSAFYRFNAEHWLEAEKRAEHINMVMTQISTLNSRLQHFAKKRGREAVEEERLRITRDLHDSCGYVFVNISSMMDAAMSRPEIPREDADEIFMTVRNLASSGLQQTRKTLHQIRDIQEGEESIFNAIKEIRDIFRQVTNINVEVESGNIKNSYGRSINSVIIRTMQEGLTNSIRHGNAQNVYISFWEENSVLTMRITDDGIGSTKIVKGIGLAGMEERVARLGGSLEVSVPKQGGFTLEIQLPLTIKETQ